jgi:hypothetical protein
MLLPSLPLGAVLADPGLAKRYGVLGPLVLQLDDDSGLPEEYVCVWGPQVAAAGWLAPVKGCCTAQYVYSQDHHDPSILSLSTQSQIHPLPFFNNLESFLPFRVPVEMLQRHGLLLGPLPLGQLESTRLWLHDGALKALFHVDAAATATSAAAGGEGGGTEAALRELSALPRERVGVCLTVEGAPGEADVAALGEQVGMLAAGASTVLVRLVGVGAEAEEEEEAVVVAFGKALHQATKPKGGEFTHRVVVVGL